MFCLVCVFSLLVLLTMCGNSLVLFAIFTNHCLQEWIVIIKYHDLCLIKTYRVQHLPYSLPKIFHIKLPYRARLMGQPAVSWFILYENYVDAKQKHLCMQNKHKIFQNKHILLESVGSSVGFPLLLQNQQLFTFYSMLCRDIFLVTSSQKPQPVSYFFIDMQFIVLSSLPKHCT